MASLTSLPCKSVENTLPTSAVGRVSLGGWVGSMMLIAGLPWNSMNADVHSCVVLGRDAPITQTVNRSCKSRCTHGIKGRASPPPSLCLVMGNHISHTENVLVRREHLASVLPQTRHHSRTWRTRTTSRFVGPGPTPVQSAV